MAAPFSLEDTFRRHDEAIYFWLGGMLVDYGAIAGVAHPNFPILRVFASPDRAWASVVETLVKQGWISGVDAEAKRTNAKNDFAVLPLPLVSIVRGDPVPNPEGGGVPKRFRRQQFDETTQQWKEHPWPGSYRTEYRVTFWSAKRYTEVFMREWIMSQVGRIGAGESEVFIPVVHAEPWGTLLQAIKAESSSDLTELEGEAPRYIRFEFVFNLNTLHFRLPTNTYDYQDTIAVGAAFLDGVDPSVTDPLSQPGVDLAPATQSGNLYVPYYPPPLIPIRWPKAGNATVANSSVTPTGRQDPGALVIEVTDPSDQVDLTNRPIHLDLTGRAILSVAFQFKSTDATALDLQQHDGSVPAAPVWSRVGYFPLPASPEAWLHFHQFVLATDVIFDLAFIGTGVDATLRIAGANVKHIHDTTHVVPTSSVVLGNTRFAWTALEQRPYLVVLAITPTNATGTATVEDDDTSPGYTKSVFLDDALQRSVVFLVQPKASSLVVRIPISFTIAAAYAQRYDGGYAGHDL